jgi:ketosteroid isomerase-like protein/uncharacterized RmlC-like cupin family protein
MKTLRRSFAAAVALAPLAFVPALHAADSAMTSERVVRQYLAAWDARNIDAMLRTLAPDAVVVVPQQAPIQGRAAIRPLLKAFVDDFSQPGSTFRFDDLRAHGPIVTFRWSGDTPSTNYANGSNTFVVRNGRIAYLTVALQAQPKTAADSHAAHTVVSAEQLAWSDAPPVLPKGVRLAVLSGDPGKPGLFVMRVQLPAGTRIAPHWHSSAEHVTVLKGVFRIGMGTRFDDVATTPVGLGGFFVAPPRMPHFARAEGDTVLEVTGLGPFDLNYVDPQDNPSLQSSAR